AAEFFQRGAAKHWIHEFAGAETDLTRAVSIHPANATYLYHRGRNRIFAGKLKEAQDDLKKAVGVDPKDGLIGLTLGDAYYLDGAWFEAIRAYKKAGETDPTVEDAGRLRSWRAQTRAGEKDAAVADLQEWLKKRKAPAEDGEFKRVSSFFAGASTEELFLQGIDGGDGRRILELRCRMYYDAGVKRLIAGDPATAKVYFNKAVETDVKDQIAHAFASAELAPKK
ncbi:MAG TPA: hypothetical protein VJB14_08625, partial [Planctomycetota bacterium]|nr:hypothetical protein [Planctomycetota bacterium]